ncbi:LptF/LptG family permease [candidate division KSB1 bacterium]
MKKIDIYIVSLFLRILIFSLLSFMVIFLIFAIRGNLGNLLNNDVPFPVVVKYIVFYIPNIIVLVLPASVLIASLFSIGHLSKRNEIAALRASGISLYRIMLPLITAAFIISIFSLVFIEIIVPVTSRKKLDIYRKYIRKLSANTLSQTREIYFKDTENRVVTIQFYSRKTMMGHQVNFTYRDNDMITKIVQAKTIVWEDSVWVLNNAAILTFDGKNENVTEYERLPYPALKFRNEDLAEIRLKPEEMDFFQLKRFIEKRRVLGEDVREWLVELMMKILLPFSNLIIVLFGVPLVSKSTRRGGTIGLGFGIGLVICFFFFGTVTVGQNMGRAGMINPYLAAWMGNIIFAVIGLFLLVKAKK